MSGRIVTVLVLLVALTIGSGVWLYRWWNIQQAIARDTFSRDPRMPPLPMTGAPIAKVVVDNDTHNFGEMEQATTRSHSFVVRNVGAAPLLLVEGDSSCRCTLSNVASGPIPPGGSAEIKLEWTATAEPGTYRQNAAIFTNDPTKRTIRLNIEGTIVNSLLFEPTSWTLTNVNRAEPQSEEFTIFSEKIDDLEITKHEFDRDKAKVFSLEYAPVPAAELPTGAKSGIRGKVMIAANGLSIGKFRQKLMLHTNSPGRPPLEFHIEGRAYGAISVAGKDYDLEKSALLLGIFPSEEGAERKLTITVRGPKANEVEFVAKHTTEGLKIEFGEKKIVSNEFVTIPLTVSVPPGTPAMSHWGTDVSPIGSVILDSGVLEIGSFRLVVRFIVEGGAEGI